MLETQKQDADVRRWAPEEAGEAIRAEVKKSVFCFLHGGVKTDTVGVNLIVGVQESEVVP